MPTVLSIGQCGFDHPRLSRIIAGVGAQVDAASSMREAKAKMADKAYDLVLVNRIFDATGESGVEFIKELKLDGIMTPLMLVSDYPDAQAAAVTHGARPGFGKSQLGDPALPELLRAALQPAQA